VTSVFRLLSMCFVIIACAACSNGSGSSGGAGSSSVPAGICRRNTISGGCWCASGTASANLNANEESVPNCDQAPSGVSWSCCYNIDGNGRTDTCNCAVPLCTSRDGTFDCECGYQSALPANVKKTSTCSASKCCTNGVDCSCTGNQFTTCNHPTSVSSCSAPTAARKCDSGMRAASSCAGLTWK
jgi:hypothetical protein